MTNIAEALRRIIGQSTGKAFAERIGVNQTTICRILTGVSLVDRKSIDRIARGIPDPNDRATLIEAWVRDQFPDLIGTGIEVTVHPTEGASAKNSLPKLSPEVEGDFRYWWRKAAEDPMVGLLFHQLRLMRR